MLRSKPFLIALCLLALGAVVASILAEAPEPPPDATLVRRDQITYFHHPGCPQCADARPLVEAYAIRHPELPLVVADLAQEPSRDLRRAYNHVYEVPRARRFAVPAAFLRGAAYLGLSEFNRLVADLPPRAEPPGALEELGGWADTYGASVLRGLLIVALLGSAALIARGGERERRGLRAGVRVLLALVLVLSAATHIFRFDAVTELIRGQWRLAGLLSSLAPAATGALVGVEVLVAVALAAGRPRRLFPWASLGLYGGFLMYAVAAQALGVSGECGCFPWPEALSWSTVGRNVGFVALSVLLLPPA